MARNELNQNEQGTGILLRNVLAGFLISLAVSFILFLIFAVVMNAVDSETVSGVGGSRILAVIAVCAGTLTGSFITASRTRQKGLISGVLIGIAMYALVLILSLITAGRLNLSGFYPYLLLVCVIISGAAGGIAGVNIRRAAFKR